ncbi:S9 family peptidase [Qipengyuania spongiae]|uniref:S9 family peptidase n=1 Tax=Qipengyuania spongiae TaxID=2909673 RepID=A0ABY5T556_9SPHN|nr:S9 family peptidase [Qipengyuania spongiae]UVI40473.1 S9 family peptidase [Qipengyuania spongiae]
MIRKTRFALLAAAASLSLAACNSMTDERPMTAASTQTVTAPAVAAPLIPRQALFGNPTRTGGQISPDGRYLSWMAPWEGTLNVYVAPADNPSAERRMTSIKDRPPGGYFWAPDGKSILYVRDKGGDENFLLYGVDLESGEETVLTPFEKTRVQVIGASTIQKDKLLIGVNNRDPRFHDVHLLDLNTGKTTLVQQNDSYTGFMADNTLTLRMAMRQNAQGGTDYFPIANGKVAETPIESTTLDDALTTSPAGYTTDGKTLYWIDSRGRDTAALYAQNVATGERRLLAESDKADLGGTLRDPMTGEVLAYSTYYLQNEWTATDPATKASFDFLDSRLEGEWAVQDTTEDNAKWLVANDPVTAPSATYLYDRKAGTLTRFYTSRPELEGAPLQPMYTREITARDGLTLPTYLTLPAGSDPDADGVPDAPVPLVMIVHGGPWARDGYGYNSSHQWLANRGYAVMSVNFRGSTGFGKAFTNAGNKNWRTTMQYDIHDALDWAVQQGITTRDKAAIMGGSYGGYATLANMAFYPEKFACGVDIVGPSNLETLLKTIPPYWEPIIRQFHDRMGDPGTPEGLAALKEMSPLYAADRISKPLLIGQGANDPRVNKAESDQIVEAMEADGIPVTYVLFPDEGHGFREPANNIAFNAVAENFLSTCLGGRAEPVGNTVANSSAQIVTGGEYVRGLGPAAAR